MNFKIAATGAATLLIKRYAGPFWVRRRWLNRTQWLSKPELQKIQLRLLKRLIYHCYKTVQYYKHLMDERKIVPDDIKSLGDIRLFPILSKENVLEAGDSIISTKYPKWTLRAARTGGSTSSPLVVYRNWFSIGNEHAFVRRQWDWAGVSSGDKRAYLMGRVVAKPDRNDGRLYAYDMMMRDLILSTHHLCTRTARDYAQAIKSYGIRVIIGYPSAINFLARTCLDSGIELKLKTVLTTSELLSEPMRSTIMEAFRCKVFDFYGSAERVCYIHACERGTYHIIPEYGLTELIPVNGPGNNSCRVIATGFWNFAMPLIRYDMGDTVVQSHETCPCGRQFDLVKSIQGREGDVIRTPSGRHLGVTLIIHVICDTKYIAESQIIQDAIDHLTIEYVPTKNLTTRELQQFRTAIAKYLPSELEFDFRKVDAVKRTSSGKIRLVVSQIQ